MSGSPRDPIELMLSHRSVRTYTDEAIPEATIRRAVEAGQAASTSSAVQAYCVIRVTDAAKLARLAELAGPQEKVRLAPEFFVICGDVRRHRLIKQTAGEAYDQSFEAFLLAVIDATLFAQNMGLAFEAMGYGLCYVGGLRNRLGEVVELLALPEGVYPVFGLCVGKPAETPSARPRLAMDAVLFENGYPADGAVAEDLAEYDERYAAYLVRRGAEPSGWSQSMLRKFAINLRPDLAGVYRGQGARLD